MHINVLSIVLLSLVMPGIFGAAINIHEYSPQSLVAREVSDSTTDGFTLHLIVFQPAPAKLPPPSAFKAAPPAKRPAPVLAQKAIKPPTQKTTSRKPPVPLPALKVASPKSATQRAPTRNPAKSLAKTNPVTPPSSNSRVQKAGPGKSISTPITSARKVGSKANPSSGPSCPITKGKRGSIYRRGTSYQLQTVSNLLTDCFSFVCCGPRRQHDSSAP
jgi:hypothetical protein